MGTVHYYVTVKTVGVCVFADPLEMREKSDADSIKSYTNVITTYILMKNITPHIRREKKNAVNMNTNTRDYYDY